MKRFAKTVVKVLTAYTDLLKSDFHNHVANETTVTVFLGLGHIVLSIVTCQNILKIVFCFSGLRSDEQHPADPYST